MSGNGITEEERVRIRAHLGYMNVSEASTFVLGTPAGVETAYLVEPAINRVLLSAVPRLRKILLALDSILDEMLDNVPTLIAGKVGSIDIDDHAMKKMQGQYVHWQGELANMLGITVNPWDKRPLGTATNVPVIH